MARKLSKPRPSAALLIKKFSDFQGIESPKRAGDAGFDLVAAERTELPSRSPYPVDIPCHFAMKIPDSHFGLIISRSSTPRFGIEIVAGIIDAGYTGPMYIRAYNRTDSLIVVEQGRRLAQLVLIPKFTPPLRFVRELPKTDRGSSRMGSTGA